MDDWPEIKQCFDEKRRELVIKGSADILLKIEKLEGKLPDCIYQLQLINFLEVSGCDIATLSENLKNLSSLTQLIVSSNKLESLPESICTLSQLKILDVSYNNITHLPEDFGSLVNLQGVNLNGNSLSELPQSVEKLELLSSLNISNNKLDTLPEVLLQGNHNHLSELKVSHSEIEYIADSIGCLAALKVLDVSGNKIKELPQTLSNCTKLKQADYKDNPLKDRRLKKLIEQNNSSQKAIMEYIRTKGRPTSQEKGQQSSGGKKKKKGKNVKAEVDEDLIKHVVKVLKFSDGSKHQEATEGGYEDANSVQIVVSDEIKQTRPYIVCCIIRRLKLSQEGVFKKFIAIQTKLHEDICGKRTIATIASHDMSSLRGQTLHYQTKEPTDFKIQPLGRLDEVSGFELYKQLKKEAEAIKREKKRNQTSGIYRYLSMLENQEKFAFVSRSSDNAVISLPPLTNSEITKMNIGISDVLLEVTGSHSLGSCKSVMDKLLQTMLEEGMYSDREHDFYSDSSGEETDVKLEEQPFLAVQQVKILDSNGKLKVLYPSRTDLDFSGQSIKIERPH